MELRIDVKQDFKELFPFLKHKGVYQDLSSDELWAVYLFADINSPLNPMRVEDRIEEIKKQYFDVDFDKLKEAIKSYPELFLSKTERELKAWLDKIEERNKFLEATPYNLKDSATIDEMLIKSKMIWDGYKKVYDAFKEDQKTKRNRGGQKDSFLEERTA
jgi:hypothetical protein